MTSFAHGVSMWSARAPSSWSARVNRYAGALHAGVSAYVGDDGALGLVVTPEQIQVRLDQIKTRARALAADIEALPSGQSADLERFARAYGAWLGQLEAYAPDWTARLWGGAADRAESFARDLGSFERALATRFSAPTTYTPAPDAGGLGWGAALWALAGGAATLAVVAAVTRGTR